MCICVGQTDSFFAEIAYKGRCAYSHTVRKIYLTTSNIDVLSSAIQQLCIDFCTGCFHLCGLSTVITWIDRHLMWLQVRVMMWEWVLSTPGSISLASYTSLFPNLLSLSKAVTNLDAISCTMSTVSLFLPTSFGPRSTYLFPVCFTSTPKLDLYFWLPCCVSCLLKYP